MSPRKKPMHVPKFSTSSPYLAAISIILTIGGLSGNYAVTASKVGDLSYRVDKQAQEISMLRDSQHASDLRMQRVEDVNNQVLTTLGELKSDLKDLKIQMMERK